MAARFLSIPVVDVKRRRWTKPKGRYAAMSTSLLQVVVAKHPAERFRQVSDLYTTATSIVPADTTIFFNYESLISRGISLVRLCQIKIEIDNFAGG